MAMELYHVLNRGVEKRDIFMDDKDRIRFIHDLYEFNTTEPVINLQYRFKKNMDLRNPYIERRRIVDIHGWCLMKNHYHLLISECTEGGLTLFLRKLNIGYANYFNERYKRSGSLFQGRTKKKRIDSHVYFLHILNYIHLNPLDYLPSEREWRRRKIRDTVKAAKFLDSYRWSSYMDYSGKHNFPSVLTTSLFSEKTGDIRKKTLTYLRSLDIDSLLPFTLE